MTTRTKSERAFGSGYRHYRVEVETWTEEGEKRSECFIHHEPRSGRATGCSASLACAQDTGYLENHSNGSMHEIEMAVVDEIEAWALGQGY